METIRPFDTAEHLRSEEDIRAYLEVSFEEGDSAQILAALNNVARARKNMAGLAKDAGISREGLYKGLSSKGNPSFVNVAGIVSALGYRLDIKPIAADVGGATKGRSVRQGAALASRAAGTGRNSAPAKKTTAPAKKAAAPRKRKAQVV